MRSFSDTTLFAGDRVILPKSEFRLVQHHAIYDGEGFFYENKAGVGVVCTPIAQFFQNVNEITAIRRFNGTEYQRYQAIQRAQSLLGRRYSLTEFNCEHYADYVQYGKARSRQVENVLGGVALAVFVWAVSEIASNK